ncbi:hypothetical protein E2L08_09385 [Palleronia sediminis]|uniref:Cytochrome c domain-containing protein n=1 Tax=Palleronia sediminis TaxID=2547833 RepID=A0A4R6A779_9RHOB|nr:hypothetical protein [Palleronia sediminis]TDL79510.1 hypothetical protein E2L08_09385 [Palleronia sediminis]
MQGPVSFGRRVARAALVAAAAALASPAAAQDGPLGITGDAGLRAAGLLDFLAPRFALKHAQPVEIVEDGAAVALTRDGAGPVALRTADGAAIHVVTAPDPRAEAFRDWLLSDIGQRTVAAFVGPQGARFSPAAAAPDAAPAAPVAGDADEGLRLSKLHCGRCHVVDSDNPFTGIGSAPSFAAMRNFPDWRLRFDRFYDLNPHPYFTQVAGVTEPFDRAPHIAPVTMTPDEVAAVTAFAARIAPKDLGAPVASR